MWLKRWGARETDESARKRKREKEKEKKRKGPFTWMRSLCHSGPGDFMGMHCCRCQCPCHAFGVPNRFFRCGIPIVTWFGSKGISFIKIPFCATDNPLTRVVLVDDFEPHQFGIRRLILFPLALDTFVQTGLAIIIENGEEDAENSLEWFFETPPQYGHQFGKVLIFCDFNFKWHFPFVVSGNWESDSLLE